MKLNKTNMKREKKTEKLWNEIEVKLYKTTET